MPVTAPHKVHGTPAAPPSGLSPRSLELWRAATTYRRLADRLTQGDSGSHAR